MGIPKQLGCAAAGRQKLALPDLLLQLPSLSRPHETKPRRNHSQDPGTWASSSANAAQPSMPATLATGEAGTEARAEGRGALRGGRCHGGDGKHTRIAEAARQFLPGRAPGGVSKLLPTGSSGTARRLLFLLLPSSSSSEPASLSSSSSTSSFTSSLILFSSSSP